MTALFSQTELSEPVNLKTNQFYEDVYSWFKIDP